MRATGGELFIEEGKVELEEKQLSRFLELQKALEEVSDL